MLTNRKIGIGLLILFLLMPFCCFAQQQKALLVRVFHSPQCSACIKTMNDIIPPIAQKFKDKVSWEFIDITDSKNYKRYLKLEEMAHRSLGTPTVLVGHKVIVGMEETAVYLENFINEELVINRKPVSLEPTGIDLFARFRSLGPLTVIGAGLIDGINPCAFTVIVFFVSFLTLMGYKRKELIAISFAYIFAVFLTYFALGLGFFKLLYSLKLFHIISKIIYLVIGGLSLFLGSLAMNDYFRYKRTGETEGLALQLPKTIKNKIHSLVGTYYRKDTEGQRKALLGLFASALIIGFLVSLLEAVCTGQLYLPTIVFVLKEGSLRVRALLYLVIYNIMFVVPLIAVFLLALAGVSSKQLEAFGRRHLGIIKIAMAAVFFALGIALWLGA